MTLEWAKLIVQLVGSLVWPVAAILIALSFRPQLRELLGRVRKIHAPGFDLEADAERLTQETAEIKDSQYPDIPLKQPQLGAPSSRMLVGNATLIDEPTEFEKLLVTAASAPLGAAVTVRYLVESELRRLLAATGRLSRAGQGMRQIPFGEILKEAEQSRLLSPELISSIRQFHELANGVIHGQANEQGTGTEITAAGLNIIRALRSIPHQRNFVDEPRVQIFSDKECAIPAEGHGIILKAVVPPNNQILRPIYPTTKDHFQKNKEVAWEWDSTKRWGPTWYHDPQSGQIKQAWSGSLEFVGRHLEDV
jgi:hypothetical protein